MKAEKVLRRYAAGERDFRRINLRGQSFKGKDLSGADFTEADIRGANFTNAFLQGAKFRGANAGLQHRWAIGLVIASWLLSGLSGLFLGVSSFFIRFSFDQTLSVHGIIAIIGLIGLIVLEVIYMTHIRKGLAVAFLAVIAFVLASFGAAVFVGNTSFAAIAGFVVVAGVTAGGIGIFVIAAATAGIAAFAIAGVFAGVFAFVTTFAGTAVAVFVIAHVLSLSGTGTVVENIAVGGAFALVGALLSVYIAWIAFAGIEEYVFIRKTAIAFASIEGTSFRGADLTDGNFTQATLKSTDFRYGVLIRTRWYEAKKLEQARVGYTILIDSDVRDLVVTNKGTNRNYIGRNLKGANLVGANLNEADFTEANISEATFQDASLERTNLRRVQALGANFEGTRLTGACLENWQIDQTTKLVGAICDYIYLQHKEQERRPSSGVFSPGEFAKIFQESLETVDLIFRNGVDWKAFVFAFKNAQTKNQRIQLVVQSIENKGDGVVVIRVGVPKDANKPRIHSDFMQGYELAKRELEPQYQARIEDKDKYINQLFYLLYHSQEKLGEVPKFMSEAKKEMNFYGNVGSVENQGYIASSGNQNTIGNAAGDVKGDQKSIQHIHNYAPEQRQALAEAAAEIQQLLKQLEQTNPTATETEQTAFLTVAIPPTKRQRFANALRQGGKELFKELMDNIYINVAIAAIEGWQSNEQ